MRNEITENRKSRNKRLRNKRLKKPAILLTTLVSVLGASSILEYVERADAATKLKIETNISSTIEPDKYSIQGSNYQFKDIENMNKAKTVEEAFNTIFGDKRLLEDLEYHNQIWIPSEDASKNIVDKDGKKYLTKGTYTWKNKELKVNENIFLYSGIIFNFNTKNDNDSRMEMIDFLHYLQYSGLTRNNTGDEYFVSMNVFQPSEPGMSKLESHQKWSISTSKVELMDFSDKEDILYKTEMHGIFEEF